MLALRTTQSNGGGATDRKELGSEVGGGDPGPKHRIRIWRCMELEAEVKPQRATVTCPELLNDHEEEGWIQEGGGGKQEGQQKATGVIEAQTREVQGGN